MATLPAWPEIALLFQAPHWLPEATRVQTGNYWIAMMRPKNLDLTIYEHVSAQSAVIYRAVLSKDMPHTSNPAEYFPPEALARFKEWMDLNCPR